MTFINFGILIIIVLFIALIVMLYNALSNGSLYVIEAFTEVKVQTKPDSDAFAHTIGVVLGLDENASLMIDKAEYYDHGWQYNAQLIDSKDDDAPVGQGSTIIEALSDLEDRLKTKG